MKIAKVKVTNFKCYEETFSLRLNEALNVIVGGNESGKTTILEAIHLALTGMLHGRPSRTTWLATSSTWRPSRSTSRVSRPEHPYRRRPSPSSCSSRATRANWPN